MNLFLNALRQEKEYSGIVQTAEKNRSCLVSGVVKGLRSVFTEALCRDTGRCVVAVFADEKEALELYEQFSSSELSCAYLPAREPFFGDAEASGHDLESSRLRVFTGLAAGDIQILFATAEALSQQKGYPLIRLY